MSRPSLVRSHTSTYSQIGSKDPDAIMSQNQYAPTTPSSQKSNRQLGYDPNTPNGSGTPLLHTSPSQEIPGPARFMSPPPANPGSRPGTSAGGPSTAMIPRPGTAQTVHPRERSMSTSNTQSYWGPLPRGYNNESFDMGRPAFYKRHSYNDYENMGAHQMQFEDNDTQALEPTPRAHKQASVDPFPTDVQRIPVNADSPLHQMNQHVRRVPSDSFRSLRYDTKKRSYRFDGLSDIESEGARGVKPGSFYTNGRSTPVEEILRLPLTWWMNSTAKNHFVAMMGEFVGTTMFLFFAFAGTQVANVDASNSTTTTNATNGFSPIVLLYTAFSFGFSLMVNVWIFFRISGGLFNPAVTLAMVMVKSLDYVRGSLLFIAQICGSLLASVLVRALFPTSFNVRTTLSEDTSRARGVFIEAILTAELVFTIFMLAKEKHRATYMAPVGIGLSLFIAELVGVFYTGGSLNPARSFGPCAVTGVWDSEHWIYWLGPALGALFAVIFYKFIKILEYEIANPGQDAETEEPSPPQSRDGGYRKKDEEA